MCGYSWTTAPKYEYCPKCCHEMDKIEGEHPKCHFTINEGDAGDFKDAVLVQITIPG
jgi:hypothetical protein